MNGATWTPSYNIRTDADRKNVRVEYNASIVQTSGEDWTSVNMTLSTATPSLVAQAPKLDPLAIALGPARSEPDRRAGRQRLRRGQERALQSASSGGRATRSRTTSAAANPAAAAIPAPAGRRFRH